MKSKGTGKLKGKGLQDILSTGKLKSMSQGIGQHFGKGTAFGSKIF